jgi:DNA-directed RNA polymerase subunit beta'
MNEQTNRENDVNSIYMMAHSGARGSAAQMKQLAGMRGLMAKPSGEIIETPIISNFKEGLNVLEYFNSTHGARKGLADTALKTANSGYLTRRLVDVAQDCIITEVDCKTDNGIEMTAVIDSGEEIVSLSQRLLGRVPCEDIIDPGTNEVIAKKGKIIEEYQIPLLDIANLVSVQLRSVLTCETKRGACATCYGRDLARGTPVNIGEAVGVIAAQSIGEPGTQLTMRTFHIGGTAQVMDNSYVESNSDGSIKIENLNTLEDSDKRNIVIGRTTVINVIDENGTERASHKLPYGSQLMIKDGDSVKKNQRLAQWDPYTIPIITETAGTVGFEDLVDGISIGEVSDESTGISQKVVIDWKNSAKSADFKPSMVIKGDDGEIVSLENNREARYLMSVDAIISSSDGTKVGAGDVIARIPTEGAKTKDITGGLPRVAELFEARKPKDHAIIAEVTGRVEFARDYKNKKKIVIHPIDESESEVSYLIAKGKHISVQDGDTIEKGEYLIDGNPAPHDILSILGLEALASYLVNEIQSVYRLQGVTINDKHIEVITRQMLQKVEISNPGDSAFIAGEQLDKLEAEEINEKLITKKQEPMEFKPILLGITKASLQTRSFISAASFQETTRVLTDAAVYRKSDHLIGLKENVIVGRLIPAGTGSSIRRLENDAALKDEALINERTKDAEPEEIESV